jgi:hypothetical protein
VKLLADRPPVDVEKPPHRPVMAILGGVAVLAVMLGVGVALLLTSDNGSREVVPAADTEPVVTIDLDSWVAGASDACAAVADRHGSVVDSGESSLTELDLAVRSLAATVREIPLPTDRQARAEVLRVVLLGDEAEQAWYGIAGLDRDEVATGDLANADGLARTFLAGLDSLGVDCSELG